MISIEIETISASEYGKKNKKNNIILFYRVFFVFALFYIKFQFKGFNNSKHII